MRVPSRWFADQVLVERRAGAGAAGPVYETPVTVVCAIQERRQVVRDSQGREVVSETTVRLPPGVDVALFTPESKVTVNGRVAMVINVSHHTLRGRLVYVAAALT